jgi:hypothetical protein
MTTPFLLILATSLPLSSYRIVGDSGGWARLLESVGFRSSAGDSAQIRVVRSGLAPGVEESPFLVLEGDSPAARALGFRPTANRTRVASVRDEHSPDLRIDWEQPLELPVYEVPEQARVFARERRYGAPLIAGLRRGAGAVLWVATDPGSLGYERFPFLLHALAELGVQPPFRSRRLWAFFDSSYRLRADPDYLARRWRSAGIAALHVAAWHYYEPDAQRDEYLRALVEGCHRHGILVYAWLELPHVSEKFWDDHPEWREKTAVLQDAHLDWRKLMNLANGFCFRAAVQGVRRLLEHFDWDGVNLAELYFESLQGHESPSRFTPMNGDVRREFRERSGFDPIDLFDETSPRHHARNPAGLRKFLEFRVELAGRIQEQWLAEVESIRRRKPHLDVALTHVDNRLDSRMRDAIGADAARILPLLDRRGFTLLVEDPATVWNLGPDRYARIAAEYLELNGGAGNLAIDINIVERYQDVYPTKRQTGAELFQLVNTASRAFPRVALYFEHSLSVLDLPWLPSSGAVVDRVEQFVGKLLIESKNGVGIPWSEPARVNGRPWPAWDGGTLWLPAGRHTVEAAAKAPDIRLLDFNGDLKTAALAPGGGLEVAYRSSSRALAILDHRPRLVEVDGSVAEVTVTGSGGRYVVFLPRGQHVAMIEIE